MKLAIKSFAPSALAVFVALGGGLSSTAVLAAGVQQEPSLHSLSPQEVASGALTPQTANGIRYVSGGIGIEERAWMAEHGKEYNIHATFAVEPGGVFVADVPAQILTQAGKVVLETTVNGPQMMVQLPDGAYELIARHDGQVLKRAFTVTGAAQQTLVFGFTH